MAVKRFAVNPAYLVVPATAWPTVLVFICGLSVWATPLLIYRLYGVQTWWTVTPSTTAIFVLFTPMHDAAHRWVIYYWYLASRNLNHG